MKEVLSSSCHIIDIHRMYRFFAALAGACVLYAQDARPPQDLLKEAVTFQQAGNFDAAIRDYRLLLAKYPNIAEVRSNLGAALANQGQYSQAVTEYKRALELKPNPQVSLNLALAYYKMGELQQAINILKKVRNQAPSNVQAVLLLADCYLRTGQNKDVIELLDSLQRTDEDNAAFNYLLGTALVRDGQTARGQLIIDKILKNGDSAEARLLMGTTKFMVKDFSGAMADFQKAAEMNPNLPEVHSWYGQALLSTGDQAGAKQQFLMELQSDPQNFDANLRMGVLSRQDEDNDQALKYFRHALEVRPGDFGARYQIASVEVAKGDLASAQRDLESIVKEAPTFTEAHVSLATVYFREKRKVDGDRERATVARLNAARQANEPAVKAASSQE
jgi:tetratricopeptide (TPR) repeat protein